MDPNIHFLILFLLTVIYNSDTTLTPKSPKGSKVKPNKVKSGPQNYSVFTKKFVMDSPNSKDIIVNHAAFFKEVDEYSYDGMVLGYITPVSHYILELCSFELKNIYLLPYSTSSS